MKKNHKFSGHFWLNCIAAALTVFALIAYSIGAKGFAYYDDWNAVIFAIGVAAAVASVSNGILQRKYGEKTVLSILGLAIGAALVVCAMMLLEVRVYSIAVLLFSELEKDNVDGYNALYCSLASVGLFFAAAGCNVAGNFCATPAKE